MSRSSRPVGRRDGECRGARGFGSPLPFGADSPADVYSVVGVFQRWFGCRLGVCHDGTGRGYQWDAGMGPGWERPWAEVGTSEERGHGVTAGEKVVLCGRSVPCCSLKHTSSRAPWGLAQSRAITMSQLAWLRVGIDSRHKI